MVVLGLRTATRGGGEIKFGEKTDRMDHLGNVCVNSYPKEGEIIFWIFTAPVS